MEECRSIGEPLHVRWAHTAGYEVGVGGGSFPGNAGVRCGVCGSFAATRGATITRFAMALDAIAASASASVARSRSKTRLLRICRNAGDGRFDLRNRTAMSSRKAERAWVLVRRNC